MGAGAVEGAWKPVIDALQPHFEIPLTPDGANSVLARLVYLLRWWSCAKSEIASDEFKKHKKFLIEIRSAICRSLRKAEEKGAIRVRPEFEDIVRKHVISHGGDLLLITTNWDNVVGSALKKLLNSRTTKFEPNPQHIHGSALTPNAMYLPTELTEEPYRTREARESIGRLHGAIWRGMEICNKSVVYGLSISPLDAELGQTLACGWSNSVLEEIEVIVPDHEVVAHRVNLLLDGRRSVAVKGYDPRSLRGFVDYSVNRSGPR